MMLLTSYRLEVSESHQWSPRQRRPGHYPRSFDIQTMNSLEVRFNQRSLQPHPSRQRMSPISLLPPPYSAGEIRGEVLEIRHHSPSLPQAS